MILSAPAGVEASEIIRIARELNPAIRVLARSPFVSEAAALFHAGADHVFSGEGEVALAMTETMLFHLGATPAQMDRERERVRSELYLKNPGQYTQTPFPK